MSFSSRRYPLSLNDSAYILFLFMKVVKLALLLAICHRIKCLYISFYLVARNPFEHQRIPNYINILLVNC